MLALFQLSIFKSISSVTRFMTRIVIRIKERLSFRNFQQIFFKEAKVPSNMSKHFTIMVSATAAKDR